MRSAVALAQAAKTDDAATRTFVANTAAEDMTVLACERFAREVGAKKPATKPAPSTQFETSLVPAESESERSAESPSTPPSTDKTRAEETARAPDDPPVPDRTTVVSNAEQSHPPPTPP